MKKTRLIALCLATLLLLAACGTGNTPPETIEPEPTATQAEETAGIIPMPTKTDPPQTMPTETEPATKTDDELRETLRISGYASSTQNTADGISITIDFTNTHPSKTIKYIDFTGVLVNAVGDVVQDTVRRSSKFEIRFTGPLPPGEKNFKEQREWGLLYSDTAVLCQILSANIEYMEDPAIVRLDEDDLFRIMDGNLHPQIELTHPDKFPIEVGEDTRVPSGKYLVGEDIAPGLYWIDGETETGLPVSVGVVENGWTDNAGYMLSASAFSLTKSRSTGSRYTTHYYALISLNDGEWLDLSSISSSKTDNFYMSRASSP